MSIQWGNLLSMQNVVIPDLTIGPTDHMYEAHRPNHYFFCGDSALNIIQSDRARAVLREPGLILDFGAGAGRVMRWLRAAYPSAAIHACDLRAPDMEFCAKTFTAMTWVSSTDIDALEAPARYDLIWV